jgi:hypothetical protein
MTCSPKSRARWRGSLAAWAGAAVLASATCLPDAQLGDERRPRVGGKAAAADTAPASDAGIALDPGGPAQLGAPTLTLLGDCVRVQVQASRPVTARALVDLAGNQQEYPLGAGATLFDGAFRVTGAAGAPASLVVDARDEMGTDVRSMPLAFAVPPEAGTLVISELLSNPVGSEARQEYVELVNRGGTPASTAGLQIADGAGADVLPEVVIAPGARALIVAAAFDEQSPGDVPPRAGTLLLRVAGRIGHDGLGQAGEPVRLIDGEGRVRSSYGGWVDTRRPAWAGHSVQRQPDEGACDHPAAWSATPLPATPGW